MQCKLIAAVGAGGKTTALRYLAQCSDTYQVLFTTTTHIVPLAPSACRVLLTDPPAKVLLEELSRPGIVCAGSRAEEGKLGRLSEPLLVQAAAAAQLTLYEADGARRLPLKLHRADEPVLLPGTDCCLVVAGLSALGRPISEAVHRYEKNPCWCATPGLPVGTREFLFCVLETVRATGLPNAKIRVLLNQSELLPRQEPAIQLAQELRVHGLACRIGSLFQDPTFLPAWILDQASC